MSYSYKILMNKINNILLNPRLVRECGYERKVMLDDTKFMLDEFKKARKLKEINMNEVNHLIYILGRPYFTEEPSDKKLWYYGEYFRLKKIYLSEIIGYKEKEDLK